MRSKLAVIIFKSSFVEDGFYTFLSSFNKMKAPQFILNRSPLFLTMTCLCFTEILTEDGKEEPKIEPQNIFDTEMDRQKYDAGKAEFELVSHYSKMPEYGQCWVNAIQSIQTGCKALTDISQSKMALTYLNCFLELQGRPNYPCSENQDLKHCTKSMLDGDRSSYATFFTHTQNICYFLQSQAWHQETQRTISRLAENSALVANQLEESSELQEKMLNQQNASLENQMQLINQATNLSQIITNSSSDVRFMFDEFNKTTQEQKLMIFDVFDRVAKLQNLVLGEFTGFYSIMFYTLSILISYMLTSTPRTSSARFWLFGIMTLNIILERLVLSWGLFGGATQDSVPTQEVDESVLYSRQWWCRQFSCVCGLTVLCVCAYRYKDLNVINNHLLVEIRKQNSDLKRFILSGGTPGKSSNGQAITNSLDAVSGEVTSTSREITGPVKQILPPGGNTTGYESDNSNYSSVSTDSVSRESDRTYVADMETSSLAESFSTIVSGRSSRASTPVGFDELRNLWNSTPVREMRERHKFSPHSPSYGPGGDNPGSPSVTRRRSRNRSTTPEHPDIRPGLQRYFLRDRGSSPSYQNPMITTESPESFTKTVKRLARLATKNSMMARFTLERRNQPFSSEEDN